MVDALATEVRLAGLPAASKMDVAPGEEAPEQGLIGVPSCSISVTLERVSALSLTEQATVTTGDWTGCPDSY